MIALRLLSDGAVVREAVFRDAPLVLGRGPEADFPIVDDSVSRLHARLDRDPAGHLVLTDLDSRNGLHVGPRRVAKVALAGRLRCMVGGVEVEIEADPGDVTRELRLHDWRRLERRRGPRAHLGYALLGVLGWLATVALEPAFWSPWEKGRAVALLGHALGALVTLPLVATLLLTLLKAFGRRLRLADVLAALAGLVWLLPATSLLAFLAYYALPSATFSALHALLYPAAGAWAAAVVATLRRPAPSRRLRALCALAVLAVAAGFGLVGRLAAERSGEPRPDFHVQAPIAGYAGRAEPLDDYFAAVAAEAEAAAAQAAAQRAKLGD